MTIHPNLPEILEASKNSEGCTTQTDTSERTPMYLGARGIRGWIGDAVGGLALYDEPTSVYLGTRGVRGWIGVAVGG